MFVHTGFLAQRVLPRSGYLRGIESREKIAKDKFKNQHLENLFIIHGHQKRTSLKILNSPHCITGIGQLHGLRFRCLRGRGAVVKKRTSGLCDTSTRQGLLWGFVQCDLGLVECPRATLRRRSAVLIRQLVGGSVDVHATKCG